MNICKLKDAKEAKPQKFQCHGKSTSVAVFAGTSPDSVQHITFAEFEKQYDIVTED